MAQTIHSSQRDVPSMGSRLRRTVRDFSVVAQDDVYKEASERASTLAHSTRRTPRSFGTAQITARQHGTACREKRQAATTQTSLSSTPSTTLPPPASTTAPSSVTTVTSTTTASASWTGAFRPGTAGGFPWGSWGDSTMDWSSAVASSSSSSSGTSTITSSNTTSSSTATATFTSQPSSSSSSFSTTSQSTSSSAPSAESAHPTAPASSAPLQEPAGVSAGAIAGIIIGTACATLLAIAVVLLFLQRRRQKRNRDAEGSSDAVFSIYGTPTRGGPVMMTAARQYHAIKFSELDAQQTVLEAPADNHVYEKDANRSSSSEGSVSHDERETEERSGLVEGGGARQREK